VGLLGAGSASNLLAHGDRLISRIICDIVGELSPGRTKYSGSSQLASDIGSHSIDLDVIVVPGLFWRRSEFNSITLFIIW